MFTLKYNLLTPFFLALAATAQASVVSVGVGGWSPAVAQTFNIKPAGAAAENIAATGFRIRLPDSTETIALCIELGQFITPGGGTALNNISFENASSLSSAARGSATGPNGTADGANITAGVGIGTLRAAQIRYLFDNFWQGSTPSAWTDPTVNIPAFQLAVWELSHDFNFSLVNKNAYTTEFYVNNSGSLTGNAALAFSAATTMVSTVSSANVQTTYSSTKWNVVLLENSSFVSSPANGVVQDLIYATAITPIPEATTVALTLAGLAVLAARRRR